MDDKDSCCPLKLTLSYKSAHPAPCMEEIKKLNPTTRAHFLNQAIRRRVQFLLADQSMLESVVEILTDPTSLDFFEIEEMIYDEKILRKRVMEALEVIHHFE